MSILRPGRRKNRARFKTYMAWIKTLGCVVCRLKERRASTRDVHFYAFQEGVTEAAHVGNRGLMQKCSDRETIPLCAEHHRTGKDSHHVLGRKFWAHHGLDRDALIKELNTRFESETA